MWRIWFFFGILEISFGAPVKTNQGEGGAPSSELVVLKCLLSSPLNSCDDVKRTVEKIPKRIQKLYEKLRRPLRDVASNEVLDVDSLDTLPISLLYLLPKIRLYSMSGLMASNIVRRYPLDDALTMKILGLMSNDTKVQDFLTGLSKYDESFVRSDYDSMEEETTHLEAPFISPAVEGEIGVALSNWFPNETQWEFWLFKSCMMSGTPILANLPSYFLNNLSMKTTEKFLFHLRNWRWDHKYPSMQEDFTSSTSLWARHTMAVKRIWANIVLTKGEYPDRWSSRTLQQLGFLLTGATPDELRNLPTTLRLSHSYHMLLYLDWSRLQARSIFDVLYSERNHLTEHDLNNLKTMISNLLPRQLQQFSFNSTNFHEFAASDNRIPLATKKQIFELQLSHEYVKNHTKGLAPLDWKRKMSHFGRFLHVVPASQLRSLINETFKPRTLDQIDSDYLSHRQARYVTKSGEIFGIGEFREEAVLSLKNLLKSIPSHRIIEIGSNKMVQNMKEHLLMFSPGDSQVMTAAILEKVRPEFGDISYLEKMLYNKDYYQYFNLLGSRDITRNFKDISSNLFILVNRDPNLERKVRLLPYNTLSTLLSLHRQDAIDSDGGWSYENLVESPLKMYISGLSCKDIQHLETADFMPVIGYYVRHKRALAQVFPKNMQHCCQTALIQYLKVKAQLRGETYDHSGLLTSLEQHEVKAVGGFILAGLPIELILSTPRKQQIISEIGKLSIPELLTATSVENLKIFANSYHEYHPLKLDLKSITALGNLVWFLNSDNIQRLHPGDFKLSIESKEENSIRALCLNEEERKTWRNYLVKVFGNPDSWTPGVVSTLGDLMIVFDSYDLQRINRTSWIESVDALVQSTAYFQKVEWPGKRKSIYLYEVCSEVLDEEKSTSFLMALKNLHRSYLESSQFLLDTIVPADRLLKLNDKPNEILKSENVGNLHFIPSLLTSRNASSNDSHFEKSKQQEPIKIETTSEWNVDHVTESHVSEYPGMDGYGRRNFSDMIQGDQEFKDEEEKEKDEDDYDYDYANDYSSFEDGQDYLPYDKVYEHSEPVSESGEVLTEAETYVRLKRLLDRLNIFKIFKSSENNSSHPRERRSIQNLGLKSEEKNFAKSLEGLEINDSRNLVMEVPVNGSSSGDKLNFNEPSKQNVKITCDAVRMMGKSASLVLDQEDVANMTDEELEDCSEVFGSLDLDLKLRKSIWIRLKEWKQSGNLLEVGNLVSVIDEKDLQDVHLELSKPWGYENLHSLSKHITDPLLMSQISDEFLVKNTNLTVLPFETAVALGRLICSMTLAQQKKLLLSRPNVFANVAPVLGSTIDCSNKVFEGCIHQLGQISTKEEAFGSTRNWNANDLSSLGVIAAGLPEEDWNDGFGNGIKPEALAGVGPAAMSCISSDTLKVFSEEQLQQIPTLSASVLTRVQMAALSSKQLATLQRIQDGFTHAELKESLSSAAAATTKSTYTLYVTVTFLITYNYFNFRTFF